MLKRIDDRKQEMPDMAMRLEQQLRDLANRPAAGPR